MRGCKLVLNLFICKMGLIRKPVLQDGYGHEMSTGCCSLSLPSGHPSHIHPPPHRVAFLSPSNYPPFQHSGAQILRP